MNDSVKSVLDEETTHWKIDDDFVKSICQFERDFVNKRSENIEFLGGALLGTPSFRFFQIDREEYFDDYLELDDVSIKRRIHRLDEVTPEHLVSSDIFNIISFYVVHRLEISDLDEDKKIKGQVCALKILHYRFLTSLMSYYFPYEPDKRLVEAVYAQLNNRFALKRAGSWYQLIENRCYDTISDESIHKKTLKTFSPYAGEEGEGQRNTVVYLINDTQTRIRDVVKNLTEIFYRLKDQEVRIAKRSSQVKLDEETQIRDLIRRESQYRRYAKDVVGDKVSFIREELKEVIEHFVYSVSDHHFQRTLEYLSDNVGHKGDKEIEPFIDQIIYHALDYAREQRHKSGTQNIRLGELIQRLRGAHMSSRSKNEHLAHIREHGNRIVSRALDTRNKNVISSVRTGVSLYIVLRTFLMSHYSQESFEDIDKSD